MTKTSSDGEWALQVYLKVNYVGNLKMNPFKLSTFEFKMKIGSEIEAGRITINSKAHPALS